MKTTKILAILVLALCLMAYLTAISEAAPMSTAFTYQGHLYDNNSVADGLYDFQFKLYDANVGDGQLGSDVNKSDVDVVDGYFTVELDFGGGVFDGDSRWLQIGVRPGDLNDSNVYNELNPRQKVTPAPYALYAATSGLEVPFSVTGSVGYPGAVFSVTNTGSGSGLYGEIRGAGGGGVEGKHYDTGNWGYLGSGKFGVYGHVESGTDAGVFGEHSDSGNYGFLGKSGAGVYGYGDTGFAGYFDGDAYISNHLGVGTDVPDAKLEVSAGGGTDDLLMLSSDEGADGDLFIIKNNGRVGIGTDSPMCALDVQSGTVSVDGGDLYIDTCEGNLVLWDSIQLRGWKFGITGLPSKLVLMEKPAIGPDEQWLVVDTDGKVGIGTTNPKNKLDIEGGMVVGESYSGTSVAPTNGVIVEGSVGIATTTPQNKLDVEGSMVVGESYSGALAAPDNGMIIQGSVGIGTNVPKNKLDVNGSMAVGTNYSGVNTAPANGMIVQGPVGIGTWDPDATLQVDGLAHVEQLDVDSHVRILSMTGTTDGRLVRWYNNYLFWDASSERYKEDIQPFKDDFNKILEIQPKSFIDKVSGERNIGFIAEEFDSLGLNHLVIYTDGQPTALKYELVSLYLLEVLKDQVKTTIQLEQENLRLREQLSKENESLKQRLAALEKVVMNQQFACAKEVRHADK